MTMNEYQNPLPCGCAVVGLELINPISGYPEYKDLHVKHCEMHANAAAELARLQAIEAAEVETNRTLRLTARHMHELARRYNEPGHSTDYFDTCRFPACKEVAALLARK